jgi:hypothetical protein
MTHCGGKQGRNLAVQRAPDSIIPLLAKLIFAIWYPAVRAPAS